MSLKEHVDSSSMAKSAGSKARPPCHVVYTCCHRAYNIYDATPELQVRTLFEEWFGIIGGAAGTAFGAQVVGLGVVAILGIGPLGAFVVVFICASAFGILGNELGKGFGGQVYDLGNRFEDRIFHSADELMGAF